MQTNDDRLSAGWDSEVVPETLTELHDCKDGSPQEDVEVERGHMDWERTEVGHVDKTNLSCRRTLDLSPEGDQRKTSSAYPHKGPSANKKEKLRIKT